MKANKVEATNCSNRLRWFYITADLQSFKEIKNLDILCLILSTQEQNWLAYSPFSLIDSDSRGLHKWELSC